MLAHLTRIHALLMTMGCGIISEQLVAYWRKARQISKGKVTHVQHRCPHTRGEYHVCWRPRRRRVDH